MKPVIQSELDAIRKLIADLEKRLKNEKDPLGYRAVFGIDRRGDVPAPTIEDRDLGKVLGVTGWVTGSGGAGTPDGHTLAVVTGVLNAEPLSGTVDARFKDLSGSINAAIAAGAVTVSTDGVTVSSISGVLNANPLSGTIDAAFRSMWNTGSPSIPRQNEISGSITGRFNNLSGSVDGHFNALSGSVDGHFNALSGTINATLQAVFSASQVWTQTTNGTEGNVVTAVLPVPYAGPQYYAFITNSTGSNSPVYRIQNKNSASFQVVSTAPFSNGDRIDFLTISGGLGPVWDGSVIANLSGTIDARFFNLSGSINSAIAAGGGGGINNYDLQYHPSNNTTSGSTYDDEFNGSVLDAKWTSFAGNGTTTGTLSNSSFVVAKTWTSDCVYGFSQAYSPGTGSFAFEVRINLALFCGSGFSSAGIGVTDGTRYAFGGIMMDGGVLRIGLQYWSAATTFVSDSKTTISLPTWTTAGGFPYPLDLWVRVSRSGNDLIASYSPNGYDFSQSTTYSNVLSGWGSITRIGMMGQSAGSASATHKARYFYFRKIG